MRFALAYASATYRRPVAIAAPVWTVAPAIIGTPTVGVVCSCTSGTFSGSSVTPTYQWTLDGVDIGGATSATYTPISGDATHALRRRSVITNVSGSDTSTSAPVTVAASSGGTVAPYAPVEVDGTGTVGSFTGTWKAPTTHVDGSALVLAGYNVRYGTVIGEQGVGGPSQIAGRLSFVAAGTLTKTVSIAAGDKFFTVSAVDTDGNESDTSFDFPVTVS